uniref:SAM domain-containing protein n=1 Tax=Acrobeloides nanus TaxID=290746 RepID=A0A914DT91_9BILA
FERDEITLSLFLNLTENDLTDMGITLFGPRKKLLNVIKQYKERGILAVEPDLAIGEATRDPSSSNSILEKKSASLKVEPKSNPNSSSSNDLAQVKNELARAMNLIGAQQKELREQFELNAYLHRFVAMLYEKQRKDRTSFDPKLNNELEQAVSRLITSMNRLKNFI